MKKTVGGVGTVVGLLVLALEIYGLKVLQALEMAHGQWRTNVWSYALEAPCAVALVLTVVVIVVSAVWWHGGEQ